MTALEWAGAVFCLLFCALWVLMYGRALGTLLRVPRFENLSVPEPSSWPKLSVVVAARDEGETIRAALASLLAEDYPNLEIVLLDDRSSDETGGVMDEMAAADARVKAVHIRELPEGWLGKVNALQVGTNASSGEWILYTDGDVHFRRGTLRKAIAYAISRSAGHLVLLPDLMARSFIQHAAVEAFFVGYLQITRAKEVLEPSDSGFVGAGAFNLVKRAALDKSPGFEWLRLEVADDIGLGLMLHNAGERSLFVMALKDVTVEWYPTLAEMFRGLEKNFFSAARYSWARVWAISAFLLAFVAAPPLALLPFWPWWVLAGGIAAYASLVAVAAVARLRYVTPFWPFLFVQIGQLLLLYAMFRSAFLCSRRGGIAWRGTLYPTKALKEGQRVKL